MKLKTKTALLFSLLFFFVSCEPGLDQEGSTSYLYIENKVDIPIEIEYIHQSSKLKKQFVIEPQKQVKVFTLLSGLEYSRENDPSKHDAVYIRYSGKEIKETEQGKDLLDFNSFILQPKKTYKKKFETYYTRVFTINQEYLDKHTIE